MIDTLKLRSSQRLIAVSDIHAHAALLHALLVQIRYTSDDALVLLGDFLERGNEGLSTVRAIMDLKKQNPDVRPLLGNWDYAMLRIIEKGDSDMIWQYILEKKQRGNDTIIGEMSAQCGIFLKNAQDVKRALPVMCEKFAPELEFLRALPVVLDTGEMIFVHGGIPHEDLESLDRENVYQYLKDDKFYCADTCFSKTVIVGHIPAVNYRLTTQSANPFFDARRNIIGIDGGCGVKRDGQINALIYCDGKFSFESVCDLPRIRALENQEGGEGTINSRYFDPVEVLSREGDLAKIRHVPTGRILRTTVSSIFEDETGLHSEATDEVLGVFAGEELFLVDSTSSGTLVKKDGVTGWYFGTWEEVRE